MSLRHLLAMLAIVACAPAAVRAADAPRVMVYDFSVSGSASRALGAAMADALAADVGRGAGVDVVRGAGTLAPAAYRDDAKAHDAEFYLMGVVQPVGDRYAVLEELVRTRTGLLAWSNTLQVRGASELSGQGADVRDVVMIRAGSATFRAVANAPADAPAPTPAPTAAPPQPAATDRAAALALAPVSPTPKPIAAYAVVTLGGAALAGDRTFAARTIADALRRRGTSAAVDPNLDATVAAPDACADTGSPTVVTGTLQTVHVANLNAPASTTASVTLAVYDCRTHAASAPPPVTVTAPIATDAIRSAIDQVLAAYFGSPPHG